MNIVLKNFKKIKIAVPPLPVQREIVQILDNFTLLTAELTARKKQYEYYRDQLLRFDECQNITGGGIGKIVSSGRHWEKYVMFLQEAKPQRILSVQKFQ